MRHHTLGYFSSYDRGLEHLLYIWQDLRSVYPDLTLHIAYGWNTFDKLAGNNPERMKWKKDMELLMRQEGIIHHGRVGKGELTALRDQCGILAYPTHFFEIDCITVKECQIQGCVPVVMNFDTTLEDGSVTKTALDEHVYAGIKVDGDIRTEEGRKSYTQALLSLLGDEQEWKRLSKEGKKKHQELIWGNRAIQWEKEIFSPISTPTVSVITPTIRKGFWSLMAKRLKEQSYPILEWIIIDDYEEDRSAYAHHIGTKYGINIVYKRGGRSQAYHFGLSTANNIGWKEAKGELLVFLQDFMFPSQDGIEALVDIYRHNPNALIAPVDVYYHPKEQPHIDREEWFDSDTLSEVVGEKYWENQRLKHVGIRPSDNPAEWEMNYGAVPRKIVDDLGGWYEFYNDGLGFDNTEFAYRAILSGYRMLVDDTNVAIGLDHWKALEKDTKQLGEGRTHYLNDPRYFWMIQEISDGHLPIKRSFEPKRLEYDIPKELSQDGAVTWMKEHTKEIIEKWGHA